MNLIDIFPVKKNCLYFNFSSDGPMPRPAMEAVAQAAQERMNYGTVDVVKQVTLWEDIRFELSRLFKSKPDNFAYTKNTSEGVLLALLAVDIKEDENYIVAEDAFPTTVKLMENLCKGSKRAVKINAAEPVSQQALKLIDKKTRAFVLDWVHFFSGKIIDLDNLVRIAEDNNIFTIIDGIQGAGAVALELDKSGVDFFVGGGHKWLLSPQGTGYIYAAEKVWQKIPRKAFGWLGCDWKDFSDFSIEPELRPGAAVMEYGTRSYTAGVGFREALRVINETGIENIETHNQELREFFLTHITKKGYETIINNCPKSASIVPFRLPGSSSAGLAEKLAAENIKVALRNGYIRASFHFMNDRREVEKFLDFL